MIVHLLTTISAVASAPYPEASVVDAFQSVCLAQRTEGDMLSSARQSGWASHEAAPGSPLANMVDIQRTWAGNAGASMQISTFVRNVNEVPLSLMIVRTAPFENWASRVDCAVFDFAAVSHLSEESLRRLSTQPASRHHTSDQIWFRQWDSPDGRLSYRVGFVPQSSSFVQQYGIVGSSLQASHNSEAR